MREHKYGDVYRMPNGALWMILTNDGGPDREGRQSYWQIPLTDDSDEATTALEDVFTGWELGDFIDD